MRWVGMIAVLGLVVAACGSGTSTTEPRQTPDTTEPATTELVETTAEPTTVALLPGPVEDLAGVRHAVVQIVATGPFEDPVEGVRANAGFGSGFIIDETGLAVTNNHVVTGAALLNVFLAGDDTPRNARVVAVSECSDLAIIDIDGDGYDFLEWSDSVVTEGTEIFAAGFPLGDSEYMLLEGVISDERAAGDTSWASIDAMIEHSANTLPGNSGGPLVTADGKVVAVNYARNDLGPSFAIGLDVARPVVDVLRTGAHHESIGINGNVIFDGSFFGVWVSSVASGSLADLTGVQGGDLLFAMEEVALGVDGTMSDYCNLLRSHDPTDTLGIELYRRATDQVMFGQINGRRLVASTSLEVQRSEDIPVDSGGLVAPGEVIRSFGIVGDLAG